MQDAELTGVVGSINPIRQSRVVMSQVLGLGSPNTRSQRAVSAPVRSKPVPKRGIGLGPVGPEAKKWLEVRDLPPPWPPLRRCPIAPGPPSPQVVAGGSSCKHRAEKISLYEAVLLTPRSSSSPIQDDDHSPNQENGVPCFTSPVNLTSPSCLRRKKLFAITPTFALPDESQL
ncbi:hypothetical protein DEO72_LG2g2953 [Vigna unguiculata]|uniref:Uncharacterized protein n=1 Tax=Vigna unguiculata TaxID=3917 RepID=A0A4D6L291_VIGUN|nr:hypothetical protein DEO72_LG2g2953 [Vigna unguiculata]